MGARGRPIAVSVGVASRRGAWTVISNASAMTYGLLASQRAPNSNSTTSGATSAIPQKQGYSTKQVSSSADR